MNEQAIVVVCAIFSAICAILYGYYAKSADWGAMIVGSCFAVIVALLSSYVLILKYM